MAKSRVLRDAYENVAVRTALQTHASERDLIKGAFARAVAGLCPSARMWLWGSHMKAETDDLSDLDIWIACRADQVPEMAEPVLQACVTAGRLAWCEENAHNAPQFGGYVMALLEGTHGLHHLDIYWQDESEVATWPDRFLVPGADSKKEGLKGREEDRLALSREPLPRGIAFVWTMTSIAAKHLAREPSSDLGVLRYCRPSFEESARAVDLPELILETHWEAGTDRARLDVLRNVLAGSRRIEDRARERGYPVSPAAQRCLERYLSLVEQIVDGVSTDPNR